MRINNFSPIFFSKDYKKLEQNHHENRQHELETAFHSPEYWQILNRVNMNKGQNIGSIVLKGEDGNIEIPAVISVRKITPPGLAPISRYTISDGSTKVGYIDLEEHADGAYIAKVENFNQDKYGGILKLSNRIAVENCLKRGIKDIKITGDAAFNSHALHYLTGKRFYPITNPNRAEVLKKTYGTRDANKITKFVLANTPKGSKYYTHMLGTVGMYMTKKCINECVRLAKVAPILR